MAVVASSGGVGDGGSCSVSRSANGTIPVSNYYDYYYYYFYYYTEVRLDSLKSGLLH